MEIFINQKLNVSFFLSAKYSEKKQSGLRRGIYLGREVSRTYKSFSGLFLATDEF